MAVGLEGVTSVSHETGLKQPANAIEIISSGITKRAMFFMSFPLSIPKTRRLYHVADAP
jgi:hypothetical protein